MSKQQVQDHGIAMIETSHTVAISVMQDGAFLHSYFEFDMDNLNFKQNGICGIYRVFIRVPALLVHR